MANDATRRVGIRIDLQNGAAVEKGLRKIGADGAASLKQIATTAAGMSATLDRASKAVESHSKSIVATGRTIASTFGAGFLFAGLAELPNLMRRTVADVAKLKDVADKVGLTTDRLQELHYQAEQNGSSADTLDESIGQFSRRMGEAAQKGGDLAKILAANGVALTTADGKMRPLNELLSAYADLMKNARSEQDRLVLATQAFGRSGDDMTNVLRGGSAELRAMAKNAQDSGVVMRDSLVDAAADIDDSFARLQSRIDSGIKGAVLDLASHISGLADAWGRFSAAVAQTPEGEQTLERFRKLMWDLDLGADSIGPALQRGFDGAVQYIEQGPERAAARAKEQVESLKNEIVAVEAEVSRLEELSDKTGLISPSSIKSATDDLLGLRSQLAQLQSAAPGGAVKPADAGDHGERLYSGADIPAIPAAKPTILPPSVRTAGAGASRTRERQNDYDRELAQLKERTAATIDETQAFGLNEQERDKLIATRELERALDREKIAINPTLRQQIDDSAAAYARVAEQMRQAQDRQQAMLDLQREFGSLAIDSISGLADGTKDWNDVLDDTLKRLSDMVLQAAIMGDGPLGGLFGARSSSSGAGGLVGGLTGLLTSVLHDGGIVGGSDALRRVVDPRAFNNAPRYHSGFGLRPDERAAILQTGEGVLSRADMKGLRAGGARTVHINVNVVGARGNQEIETMVQSGVHQALRDYDRSIPSKVATTVHEMRRREPRR